MPYKYLGDGSFLTGVPARDLTDEEWDEVAPGFEAREGVKLINTGLYEKVEKITDPKQTKAKSSG